MKRIDERNLSLLSQPNVGFSDNKNNIQCNTALKKPPVVGYKMACRVTSLTFADECLEINQLGKS